jgi:methyl-accepting chemotaxis protein/methyl-accepting chemotaxis protein-1 (serine sensor receptor)
MSALWVAQNLGSRLEQAVNGSARQQMLAGQISTATSDLESLNRALAVAMMLQQTGNADEHRRQLGTNLDRMGQLLEEFQRLAADEESRRGVESLRVEFEAFGSLQQQMQQKLSAQQMDEGLALMNGRLLPKLLEMNRTAKQLLALQGEQLAALSESAASTRSWSMWGLISLSLLSLLVGVGAMLNLRSITVVLKRSVDDLLRNAQQLAGTAAQVSSTSQSVSQAASEQAASLEETSASAEEIHSMTSRNAEHAESATRRTQEANSMITEANRALEQMVVSMNEISSSSGRISKIIKVIDDIAFQTNILALNAAVEAARAGEAGMGFAVVADEVRNLAQRSAQAAKDTTNLIEESIARAAEGKQKLDEVATAITSVTEAATKVRSLVEEVHGGSEQQAKGIEQIARAVSRMEQVTQQLAATAEEGAAAGQELTSQAHVVDEIVIDLDRLFGLGNDASRSKAAHSGGAAPARPAPAGGPRRLAMPALKAPQSGGGQSLIHRAAGFGAGRRKAAGGKDHGFARPESLDKDGGVAAMATPDSVIPLEEDFRDF